MEKENMHISRYNYEEYFLLYTDNELSVQEREAVEEFVAMNPELREELVLLQQYKMDPDEKIVFPGKESLIKIADNHFIDADNYEERFLLYADNELDGHDKACVEQSVDDNPALKEAFDLINKAVLTPDDSVQFPHKERLLRHEDEKVVSFTWWKAAAAAAVVLVAGALWLNDRHLEAPRHPVALQEGSHPSKPETASANNRPDENEPSVHPSSAAPASSAGSGILMARQEHAAQKNIQQLHRTSVPADKTGSVAGLENNRHHVQPQIAAMEEQVHAANSTAFSKISASVIKGQKPVIDELVAGNGSTDIAGSDDTNAGVTFASNNNAEDLYIANIPVDKKHALRGLFRKASRIINKATGLNTGEKGILIGNVEIALQ